jgi:flagellar biogenesis protein FliO
MAPTGRIALSLRGLLRFVVLLAAACLVGALVGLLTEPLERNERPKAAGPRTQNPEPRRSPQAEPADPAAAVGKIAAATTAPELDATPDDSSAPPSETVDPPRESLGRDGDAFASLAPDFRGIYVGCGVLAVFVIVAVLLARRGSATRAGNGVIHVVDTLQLGAGRRIHLLRCEGRKYLIANTEKGVAFLASVPQNEVERAFDAEVAASCAEQDEAEGEPGFERFLGNSALAGSARR